MMAEMRGSEKLKAAWRARLTDDAVDEIGQMLDETPARVDTVRVHGGADPVGVTVSLTYEGQATPRAGHDVASWIEWQLKHGGFVRQPRWIINGIPFPESIQLVLDFGRVPFALPQDPIPILTLPQGPVL